MAGRGRPRHPEILTPRQWEVLALIREGHTDPQIAERLDISLDGAKYHVSEIIARLGVSTREQAAAWEPAPGPRAPGWLALAWKGAAVTAAAAALAGVALLAYAVLSHDAPESTGEAPPAATGTGSPATVISYPQRPVSQVQLAYVIPSNTVADGSYFLRTVGSSEPDVPLGNYTPAGALTNNSPYADGPSYLWASSQTLGPSIIDISTGDSRASAEQLNGATAVLLGRDGLVFEENGVNGDSIVGQNANGDVLATYHLPDVPFATLYLPPGAKGPIGVGSAAVTIVSLLEDPGGHILALADNGGNSALVDLVDNRRLDLPNYGSFAASLAADGSIYALLRTNDAARQFAVARIDEREMKLDALMPVSIDADAGIDSLILVSTQAGPTFLYVTQEDSFPKNAADRATPKHPTFSLHSL